MKTIHLISTFRWFDLEYSGDKSWTIRKRTKRLEKMLENATHLTIRRGYTKISFTSKITHIYMKGDYVIISWNAKELRK